jgi:hypothetical protein
MDTPVHATVLPVPPGDASLLHDDLRSEYFAIVDLVTSFDQRLLTMKGWGVTLSLAVLAAGFQQNHYGLFLIAAVSGLAFWIVEGTTKLHQTRYYPRMGDIEVVMFNLFRAETPAGPVSSPLLDWGWYTAQRRVRGGRYKGDPDVPERWPMDKPLARFQRVRYHPLWLPHVAFPHLISLVVGTGLFVIGLLSYLGPI